MKGRCKQCRKIYVTTNRIIVKPQEITCHCGTRLTRTSIHSHDPEVKLTHFQTNDVMTTYRIPEAVS